MKHLFIIQCHNNTKLLVNLVKALNSPNHFFLIHIDKKSVKMYESKEIRLLNDMSNCQCVSLESVHWVGVSQFLTTLKLLRIAHDDSNKFDFFHLISGVDYPVKSNSEFDKFFCDNSYKAYVNVCRDADTLRMIEKHRLRCFNFYDSYNAKHHDAKWVFFRSICKLQRILMKCGITLRKKMNCQVYFGASWFSADRDIVTYILDFISGNQSFLRRFRYSECCDEVFFQTILFNSKYKNSISTDYLRFIKFMGGASPITLTEDNYNEIASQNNVFFIRKIEEGKSDSLIKMIENNKRNNSPCNNL